MNISKKITSVVVLLSPRAVERLHLEDGVSASPVWHELLGGAVER